MIQNVTSLVSRLAHIAIRDEMKLLFVTYCKIIVAYWQEWYKLLYVNETERPHRLICTRLYKVGCVC